MQTNVRLNKILDLKDIVVQRSIALPSEQQNMVFNHIDCGHISLCKESNNINVFCDDSFNIAMDHNRPKIRSSGNFGPLYKLIISENSSSTLT